MIRKTVFLFCIVLPLIPVNAEVNVLQTEIGHLIKTKKATVGVSVVANHYQDTITINGNVHFPMQSVFKFPIALAILSKIDKGTLTLNQKVHITKKDLSAKTWSPIKDKFPRGTVLTIGQILEYTVTQSDNVGCDVLLRLIGGPNAVETFLQRNGYKDISIKTNEEGMHRQWNAQYRNWSTPVAMTNLLVGAYTNRNGLLSAKSYDLLWKLMKATSTGAKELKGQLPPGTVIAHKTGSSGMNDKGVTAALNDAGVIFLPDGTPLFITVYVSNSTESPETNEKIISDIAKQVWNHYVK